MHFLVVLDWMGLLTLLLTIVNARRPILYKYGTWVSAISIFIAPQYHFCKVVM